MAGFPDVIEPLEEGVKNAYQDMCAGNYRFGRDDLPFMEVAHENAGQIPFHSLLKRINATQRKGLEVDEHSDRARLGA